MILDPFFFFFSGALMDFAPKVGIVPAGVVFDAAVARLIGLAFVMGVYVTVSM